jgi:ABC-type uncharacterized transport system involved in gliding motility auxiliary subunit
MRSACKAEITHEPSLATPISMLASKQTHLRIRLQGYLFLVLFLTMAGLLAWLSTRYTFSADWTASGRNTLSAASTALLDRLPGPVHITAYATQDASVRRAVSEIVGRYQRYKPDIQLEFVNPDLEPDQVRQQGVSVNGELVIRYQDRSENLKNPTEQGITNTLQRLARSGERWLVFLTGHGERSPQGPANHDLSDWVKQLQAKGFKSKTLNLTDTPQIPDNTACLVIAGPQVDLLPGEVQIVKRYVDAGGNLLWLGDPGQLHGLQPLAADLGVKFLAGMIVDPTTRVLGIGDPRFALAGSYPSHAITRNFNAVTLYPQATGLQVTPPAGWQGQAIIRSNARSWEETGPLGDTVQYDAGKDVQGPLEIGYALTRQRDADKDQAKTTGAKQQRIVVIGDGDFLANAYLGNGGNLELGLNLINWLAHDDQFIDIPAKTAPDRNLQLSTLAQGVIGMGWLFALPLLLAGSGALIWWRRRKL